MFPHYAVLPVCMSLEWVEKPENIVTKSTKKKLSPDSLIFIKDVRSNFTRAAVIILQLKAHYDNILIKCKAVKITETKWVERQVSISELPYRPEAFNIYRFGTL